MPREKFDWTSSCISTASWGSTCWNCISPLLRKQKSNFILSISITEQNLVNRIVQNKHFNIVNQVLSGVIYWFKCLTKSLQKGFPWSDIPKCEQGYFLCPSGVSDLTQIIWHKLHCRGMWHLKQCATVGVRFAFLRINKHFKGFTPYLGAYAPIGIAARSNGPYRLPICLKMWQ